MAETDATLQSILAQLSPASPADNLEMTSVDVGPDATPDPAPPPADVALAQRIAELERVSQRHVQQLNGSRAEIARYQALLEERERTMQQMLAQQQQLTDRLAPQTPAPEPLDLDDLIEKVALEGKKGLGKAWQQQLIQEVQKQVAPATPKSPATPADLETLLTQRERKQQLQQAILTDLGTRHKDVIDHPAAAELLPQVYAALQANPVMQALYPPDPTGSSAIQYQGATWDARLIDRAASEIRRQLEAQGQLKSTQTQQAATAPTQSPGTTRSAKDAPVLPPAYVRGEEALLNDPRIRKALEATTGLKDPRSQAKWFWDNVPDSQKAQWQRQAALMG